MSAKRAARGAPVVQIGDGNTMHVNGRPDVCAFCGSRKTAGGMGMRDGRFTVNYCKEHKANAERLWQSYQKLRTLRIHRVAP